jgi:hypothetical protein
MPVLGRLGVVKDDAELAAIGQRDPFVELSGASKTVQHPGDGTGILSEFVGLAFEPVDFFDDLYRQENRVILELEEGVGVVEQDVGVEDVVFLHKAES